jgi:hypothetical protein
LKDVDAKLQTLESIWNLLSNKGNIISLLIF